jgi:hypothetical protein
VRAQLANPPTVEAKAPRPAKAAPIEPKTPPAVDNAALQAAQRRISQLRQAQQKLNAWNGGVGDDVLSTPAALIGMLQAIYEKAQTPNFWPNDPANLQVVEGFLAQLQLTLGTTPAIKTT